MPAIGGERIPATVDNNAELSKPTGSRGESGALVRKSSIRRRLSSSENKESYGNLAEEYNKLAEKILQDPSVTKSIEALQERWKMLMFMYDDAMDLIQSRKERQLMIKWCHKRRELFAAGVVYSAISFLAFILLLVFIYIAVLLI